jgi:hypothetical protein
MERVSAACCDFSKYCLAGMEWDGWQNREKESYVDENAEAAMGRRPKKSSISNKS